MIKSLFIKDYLLIPDINLDFNSGLTVVTGETGAGKSLIVDSIELALGARADTGVVRTGCEKAEIFVIFDVSDPASRKWLQDHDLDDGEECIVRRSINRNQSSRAYINGQPASLQNIKQLTQRLVDLHGQHEHQKLLTPEHQRYVLDGFAGNLELSSKVADLAHQIRKQRELAETLEERKEQLESQIDLLQHQSQTLESLNPETGEFTSLKEELLKMTHSEELIKTLGEISYRLAYYDQENVSDRLSESIQQLERLVQYDSTLLPFAELLDEAKVRVDDVAREVHALANRSEVDPQQIEMLNERMTQLQQQARIHNINADDLPSAAAQLSAQIVELKEELSNIFSADTRTKEFIDEYGRLSSQLSELRKTAAIDLSSAVTEQMQTLGMEGGEFTVELNPLPDDQFARYGHENVQFLVSANPGQPRGPLSKVASGGELSRLSLAIQVVAANLTNVSTLIFDEIDIGIGGGVAERVGRMLRTLGESCQILCITHLPQVAAQGHNQMQVVKNTRQTANVEINLLDSQQRVSEIARMLGGDKITARTMEHAKELLLQSSN